MDLESGRRPRKPYIGFSGREALYAAAASAYPFAAGIGAGIKNWRSSQNAKRQSEARQKAIQAKRSPTPNIKMYRKRRSRGGVSRFKRKFISGRTTTEQRDSRVGYVKHRMPRGRRRRWKRFTRKVQHVMLQMGASQTFSVPRATIKSWIANAQNYWGVMLGATGAVNNDDLVDAFKRAYGSTLNLTDLDDYKLFIKSLCLDVQINNNGANTAIIEIYHLLARKPYNDTSNLESQFAATFNEIPAPGTYSRAITNPGYTPFQNALFCSHWAIQRKEQIQLGPGELSTLQIRIPANKMFLGKTLETSPAMIRNFTRGLLVICKGEPENASGTAQLSAGEIVFATQMTCNYQLPPSSTRVQTSTT